MPTCNCERCGRACQTAAKTNPDSLLIRRSTVPRGCCVDCALTNFMKTGPLKEVMGGAWSAPGFDVGAAIRLPHVQTQFVAVFKASKCFEVAEEVNWERIIENWALPIPEGWDWHGQVYMAGKRKG